MKKYLLLSLVLLPAIVLGAVTPNVTNLASFSKEQLIKVIECMVKPESAGSLKFCLEQIGGPVITSYNQTIDVNGTIDIKGKNFGTKVRVELASRQGEGEGASNYRKAVDLTSTGAGTIITVPLSKIITTEKDKAMFVGNYNTVLNVTRLSDGVVASAGYINITEDLVADKVVIGEGAKLVKTLVSGKETLVATFSVTLRSEKKSATTIPKADPFGIIAYNPLPKAGTPFYMADGPHDAFSKNTYVKTAGEAVDYGNYYIIPEGKSATFRVTATFNPLSMFGGNYVAKVRSISYGDSVGKWAVQVLGDKTPRNKTNAVVIVGEKSPFITSVSPSGKENPGAEWNGVVTISGLRFDRSLDTINFFKYQPSGITGPVKQLPVPINTTATKITLETTKLGLEAGQYVVTVTNKNNGTSNQSDSFFAKGSTTTPPVTETGSLNCPTLTGYTFTKNLAVGSTDSLDVLALQCFLISKGHLASTVKSGYFGALTKAALIKYQQSKGEVATGYFGPLTRASVNAELGASLSTVNVLSVWNVTTPQQSFFATLPNRTVKIPVGTEVYFTGDFAARDSGAHASSTIWYFGDGTTELKSYSSGTGTGGVVSNKKRYNVVGLYPVELSLFTTLGKKVTSEKVFIDVYSATSTPATTTASSLIIEKVSSSASLEFGETDISSDDQGRYDFTFKVTPVGGVAYIPLTASRSVGSPTVLAGVNFSIETDSNFTATSGQVTAALSHVSGGTRSGNYVRVEEGEAVTLKLNVSFDAGLTSYYRLQLLNVGYSGTESTPTKVQGTPPPVENFETSVVEVRADAGTQRRNTASIWEAIKSFFK